VAKETAMPTCDQMLDALGKRGLNALNKVEAEFVAIRDRVRAAVTESGRVKQKARYPTLRTVRPVRKAP
jgi:hypothetical protein